MDAAIMVVVGNAFVLVGVATGGFFCFRIFQAFASTRWPFAAGELESTELRDVVYRGREVDGGADQASARVTNFRYRYAVMGKDYQGSRVTFSDSVNKTTQALRKLQARYQGKTEIQVYYNPAKPEQSVLVPGPSIFNFTPLITSSLFIAAGIFIQTYDFS